MILIDTQQGLIYSGVNETSMDLQSYPLAGFTRVESYVC